jgi:8-oxo-dGTP pyrophosphatase MutT (NUDIX family)
MWLFVPEGFFSIVDAGEFDQELMVRARASGDLDRLRERYLPELGPNIEIPGRDYPVRAFTTHEDFARCLAVMAMALDYDNFKNEVARKHSSERAHIYHDAWHACRKIEKTNARPRSHETKTSTGIGISDLNAQYGARDLHAEGDWPVSKKPRYGAVVFDRQNHVLLREPSGHFNGYYWTFAKGAPENDEHPVDTALRETLEETGHRPVIVGHIRGAFAGSRVGATAYYCLMMDTGGQVDAGAMQKNGETSDVRWATYQQAWELISQTTNEGGRDRDLKTLDAAFEEWRVLVARS